MTCLQETCKYWTGHGCACYVLDLKPEEVFDDRR